MVPRNRSERESHSKNTAMRRVNLLAHFIFVERQCSTHCNGVVDNDLDTKPLSDRA